MNGEAVDAVIIGAGAAGGVFAAHLAEAGKRVLVLEAGAPRQLQDLVSSQIWARRLKWGLAPVLAGGEAPLNHNIATGSGIGGAALHHYGTWLRFAEDVFKPRTLHGKGIDWPIAYPDLRPHYDELQRDIGISGDATAEPWRPPGDPYPMPPLQQFRQAELLDRGFTALGKRTAPLPAIINSVPYNGRPPCIYDGWCDAGCPIGALANPLITYIPRARKAGAEFRAGCYVTRIEAAGPERVGGVEYRQDGKVRRQPAKVIIVAASVMENVRLLLNSTSTWHAGGLGNRSGLVGAYLGTECAVQGFALFNEETQCHLGLSAGHRIYREGYVSPARPGMFAGYQWQLATAMKPNDIFGVAMTRPDLFGAALHEFIRTGVRHAATMLAFGGGVPDRENRAVLSGRKDAFGMPLVTTEHRWTPDMAALIEHLHGEAKELLRASGARESWTGRTGTGHIIGGTLMGSDPAASVTDSFGRVHGLENLFVAGGSLFPGSAGTSPTYTIHAVTQRAARHVISRWAEFH